MSPTPHSPPPVSRALPLVVTQINHLQCSFLRTLVQELLSSFPRWEGTHGHGQACWSGRSWKPGHVHREFCFSLSELIYVLPSQPEVSIKDQTQIQRKMPGPSPTGVNHIKAVRQRNSWKQLFFYWDNVPRPLLNAR